jgi:hypothetical protein
LILAIFSFSASAQVVSGLYSGKLVNDSTKREQTYELALSEYRGKITGYSYTTFVVKDTFYYSVKRVKGTKENGALVVEDEKMLANNFPVAPDKGVHQINRIPLHGEDTLKQANGTWETNKTKIFYSIRGGVAMRQDNDSTHSPLMEHLKQLGIISTPHYEEQAIAKNETVKPGIKTEKKASIVKTMDKKPAAPSLPGPLPYTERKVRMLQTVDITTDSLALAFYDNGVIDGDSISVYLNGKPVISNYRLLATATKKTISLKDLGDSIQLLVVAENLGTIPPNTGLVTIREGDNQYQVNFTADLQTNAMIVLRKQKKIP